MNMAQAHRGPDDAGYFEDEDSNASLGMTRLSIQDHAGGCQPMSGYSGDLNLVFNGEIFNAPEIRLELESDGFVFSSDHSDTEVLLHLYRRDGAEMLKHLNGMFAFVIFDRSRKILLGARDQTGIKPLYYSVEGARFCFSSELKSLLKAPWVRRELDRQAIYDFFTFHCIPAPRTPFLGVRKLPPGTFFEYNLEKKNLTISEYWRPSFSRSEDVPRNRSDFGVRGALAAASERWLA